jgi:hypothetical protein
MAEEFGALHFAWVFAITIFSISIRIGQIGAGWISANRTNGTVSTCTLV